MILVVDDDALLRMVAADALKEAGYEIVEASDAQEALALLDGRSDVRLMITDIEMPGRDGIALAQAVRARCPDMSIMVTSGKIEPAPGELPGGARFLAKPYTVAALLQAVANLLDAERHDVGEVDVIEVGEAALSIEVLKAPESSEAVEVIEVGDAILAAASLAACGAASSTEGGGSGE